MPLYRLLCTNCKAEQRRLLSQKEFDNFAGACVICGNVLGVTLGEPQSRSVETVDDYRSKKVVSDIDKLVDQRAKDHFRSYELPRLRSERGDQYCIDNGFLDKNGRPT
jgi:hypothetical protein